MILENHEVVSNKVISNTRLKKSHIVLLITCNLLLLFVMASCKSSQGMVDATLLLPDTFVYNRQWQPAHLVQDGDTTSIMIKGRGHSTFVQPKHPYALRWGAKHSLGSLPRHRHAVLLANFFDHSLLRNALAMEVTRQTSLRDVTPQDCFVSLTVDDEWQGIYWASERVKDCVAHNDSLLRLDAYYQSEQRAANLPIDTLPSHIPIDTLSFVDWWLIHELCMNAEPNGPRSVYARIVGDSVLKAGPVWDFDMAFNPMGVDDGGDLRPEKFKTMHTLPPFLQGKVIRWLSVDSFYLDHAPIMQPFIHDSHFWRLARERWQELRPRFSSLTSRLRQWKRQLRRTGAEKDQRKWNTLEPARFDDATSWTEAIRKLERTYHRRLQTMDKLLGAEPNRSRTFPSSE